MEDKKILYTIFSVLALIFVVVGITFAWRAWSNEERLEQEKEKISLNNY